MKEDAHKMSSQGTTTTSTGTATAEHVFLAGRPPLGEFLAFVSSQSPRPAASLANESVLAQLG
jgi:hypothetical protein